MVTEDLTNESTGNRSPFICGDWLVEPALNRLSRGDIRVDIEPKAMNALVYLADRQGEVVTTDELIEHVWGARYVVDTAVYKAIAQLRRELGDDSRSPTYISTIRKRGYRLIAPVSAVQDPRLDAGGARDNEPAVSGETRSRRGLAWLAAAAALVIVPALLVLNRDDAVEPQEPAAAPAVAPRNSIAVLPFTNMSDDDRNGYFSDGLSEEILNSLAQSPRLRVAARTSSFYFKDKDVDIADIASELNVQSVLEGSVRKNGTTLRVTAQLIDAETGYHLWSQTYDRQDADLLSVQTEIAENVAAAMQSTLLGSNSVFGRRSITDSLEAYDAYFYGRHELERRNPESLERAVESLEAAIEYDPQFAHAYTALAHAYLLQHYYSGRPAEEVYPRAVQLLDKAAEFDSDLQYARQIRGTAAIVGNDRGSAIQYLTEAINAMPNDAGSWRTLGFAHVLNGDLKRAEVAYETANDLDPVNATLLYNLGALQMLRGNYDRGVALFDRVVAVSPDRRGSTKRYLAGWASRYGRYDEAAVALSEAQGVTPSQSLSARLWMLIGLGLWDEAELRLEQSAAVAETRPIKEIGAFLLRQGRYDDLAERFGSDGEFDVVGDVPGALLPQSRELYYWRGMSHLVAGEYAEAQEDFLTATGDVDKLSLTDIEFVLYLAYAYQVGNDHDAAEEILRIGEELVAKAKQQGWRTPSFRMHGAKLSMLLGRYDTAIEEISGAIDAGWLSAGHLDYDPIWEPLRDRPAFSGVAADVERRIEPMRDRVLQILDQTQYVPSARTK